MTGPCEDPSSEGSSHGSRGCDHRHPARDVMTQTGDLKFFSGFLYRRHFYEYRQKSILFNHCF